MSPAGDPDWERVSEIVDGALRRPDPRERSRYLKEACAGDRELRREVDDLLRFEGSEREVLERPPRPHSTSRRTEDDAPASGPQPGDRVGPYTVVRRLGEGGMGLVVQARDPELERDVAVKLVRGDLSAETLRRFENERRILARLDHPNIARIFGGGVHVEGDGERPCFAMELVDGTPVDTYCQRERLSVDERIRLVLKICDALSEAHRHLVVHRDLKPSNILVTSDGEPKLLDFGIAKELEPPADAPRTQTGHQPLSLAYASPEQVRGLAVTVASDVHAVGVLLYRLLCGHPPFVLDGDHVENVLKICEDEPPLPSSRTVVALEVWRDGLPSAVPPDTLAAERRSDPRTLRRRLQGDLDAVVLRCLAKDPRQRYPSMEQLSDDLRRHLEGHPVRARRATWAYRTVKFLRRSRWRLAAALLVVVTVLSLSWNWQRARASSEKAVEAERHADALTLFARNLVRAVDPDTNGARPMSAKEILEHGEIEARKTLQDQPEPLAHQLEALGLAHQSLGNLDAALPLLRESLALRREVYGGDHRLVARGLNNLAALHFVRGERQDAEERYREALAMKRRLGLPPLDLEKVEGNLATLLAFRGELAEAETLYRDILSRRRKSYKEGDLDMTLSLRNLGKLLYLRSDFDRAEEALREALTLRLQAGQQDSTRTASVRNVLGQVLHAQGRLDEAEAMLTSALEVQRRRLGTHHVLTAVTEKNLAEVYFDLGENAVAQVLWSRAVGVLRREKPPDAWEIADAESRLGVLLAEQGRREEAGVCLRQSHDRLAQLRGEAAYVTRRARERLQAHAASRAER